MLLKRVQGVPPPLFPLLPGTALILVVPTCIVGLPLMRDPLHRDDATYPRLHILGTTMCLWSVVRVNIVLGTPPRNVCRNVKETVVL
jgi:hypothetical protein